MWGTIAKFKVTPGREEWIVAQVNAMRTERMHGWLYTHVFRSDADPHEMWMVAMFESKEAYQRNAQSPAQDLAYRTLRSAMETDPEWHDVEEMMEQNRAG
jgi:quinol monooxygenase YgiN